MSGIAGIMNLDGAPVDVELLNVMTGHLRERGPDKQNIWHAGKVGLGHAQLATTDEACREKQPFTLDGSVLITADCRIDRRDELVRALHDRDADASMSATDPELILRAFNVWGIRCVDHLLGDFSFAVWDAAAQCLFCARDHFGVKPFFYAHTGGVFVFSNTLTCVRRHPAVTDTLDEVAIADFLVHGWPLDLDRSSFRDIRRLPPSHMLTVSAGAVKIQRYWELPIEDEVRFRRRFDYVDRFNELFDRATADRLRTSRAAVFMSGGMDSTAVAAAAKKAMATLETPYDLRAYTTVFDRLIPDEERRYSKVAADGLGIKVHHIPLDEYQLDPDDIDREWYPPEPRQLFEGRRFLDIHRRATATARVLLRGDGADALIYSKPLALKVALAQRPIGVLGDLVWMSTQRRQIPRFGFRTLLKRTIAPEGPPAVTGYPDWLNPDLEQRHQLRERWRHEVNRTFSRPGLELGDAYWAHSLDLLDVGSVGIAADVRYPFLDLPLATYLLRLPPIPWCPEKSLLRVAMKGRLPGAILRRPKVALAGNPWPALLPARHTRWWARHLSPGLGLERFIELPKARAAAEGLSGSAVLHDHHVQVDAMRLGLHPICLSLWLQRTGCANFSNNFGRERTENGRQSEAQAPLSGTAAGHLR